jgi:hypothetical protein
VPVTYNVQQLAFADAGSLPQISHNLFVYSILTRSQLLAGQLHSLGCLRVVRAHRSGCHLWNLTGDNATFKSRRSLLPVLTILFLVSYGLLTMLVVEQGRTIDSQRSLIHLLFSDSVQLSSIKGKAIQKEQSDSQARAQAQKKSPAAQAPPSVPQTQSPSTQRPQAEAKNQSTSKVGRRPLPQKPPKDTSEPADDRRTLISI